MRADLYREDGVLTAPARSTDRKAAPLLRTAQSPSGPYHLKSVLERQREKKLSY